MNETKTVITILYVCPRHCIASSIKKIKDGGCEIYTAHIHQMAKMTPFRGCVNPVVPQTHNIKSSDNLSFHFNFNM